MQRERRREKEKKEEDEKKKKEAKRQRAERERYKNFLNDYWHVISVSIAMAHYFYYLYYVPRAHLNIPREELDIERGLFIEVDEHIMYGLQRRINKEFMLAMSDIE